MAGKKRQGSEDSGSRQKRTRRASTSQNPPNLWVYVSSLCNDYTVSRIFRSVSPSPPPQLVDYPRNCPLCGKPQPGDIRNRDKHLITHKEKVEESVLDLHRTNLWRSGEPRYLFNLNDIDYQVFWLRYLLNHNIQIQIWICEYTFQVEIISSIY